MNEIKEIIRAFDQATNEGKRCALATVVQVEGSSYRRPGARMLITDDGILTGAISGGCLEGDALYKGLFAITTGENKLITYDSTNEDDIDVGLHLGCNGIVHILFEPIQVQDECNPITFLKRISGSRQDACLVTIFSSKNQVQPGTTHLLINNVFLNRLNRGFDKELEEDIKIAFSENKSAYKYLSIDGQPSTAFIEFIPPPVSLVVAGAGNDVQPLVELAAVMGWSVTVVDGRQQYAVSHRFPKADKVLHSRPGNTLRQLDTDAKSVFLLMTHNYNYDMALLKQLSNKEFAYIGLLGPTEKRERMLADLEDRDVHFTPGQLSKIHGPAGLDIGAENATEIALSILSEIKAFLSSGSGMSLKFKSDPIHARMDNTKKNA
ncbi:MAG: XdhC family protein [Bacteroidota bacterium]|nr:XdhC family protein [Bacteroidota bacterium]